MGTASGHEPVRTEGPADGVELGFAAAEDCVGGADVVGGTVGNEAIECVSTPQIKP
jgi:hypothetical protein